MNTSSANSNLSDSRLAFYLGGSSAIVNPALTFAPILVGGSVAGLNFSTSAAVGIVSAEMAATALAFLPALWWVKACSWKKVAVVALLFVVVGNLISLFCTTVVSLGIVRVLTGLFEGTLLTLYLLVIAQVKQTEKMFSGKLAAQMISAAIGLMFFPSIIETFGYSAVYVVLALASACLLYGIKLLPERSEKEGISSLNSSPPSFLGSLCLFVLLIIAAGVNVVWTYLERIGTSNLMSLDTIGLVLAIAVLIAIVSGLVCAYIGTRFGSVLPLSLGMVAGLLACVALINVSSMFFFCLGAFLIAVARVVPIPYIFGCLAILDSNKRLAVYSHIVLSLGMAGGPALAALFVTGTNYNLVLYIGLVLLIAAWLVSLKILSLAASK